MKYLISGKEGQLARVFIRRFEEKSIDFMAPDESQFDITNYNFRRCYLVVIPCLTRNPVVYLPLDSRFRGNDNTASELVLRKLYTNLNKVTEIVSLYKPDVIINCVAYNLVDKAEQEQEKAFNVNASGPKHLAYAAKRYNAFLVHFSSDYVFDGLKESDLYKEDDGMRLPCCCFQRHKLTWGMW